MGPMGSMLLRIKSLADVFWWQETLGISETFFFFFERKVHCKHKHQVVFVQPHIFNHRHKHDLKTR